MYPAAEAFKMLPRIVGNKPIPKESKESPVLDGGRDRD
jgi:hypothetical protein